MSPQGLIIYVQLLAPLPKQSDPADFEEYLTAAFPLFLALASLLAVVMLAWGALEYMFSVVPGAKEEGKKRMQGAVWGLVLLLASYIILKEINPALVKFQIFP